MAVYDPHRRKRIIWQPEFALPAAVVLAFPVVVSGIIAEISVPLAAIYLGVLASDIGRPSVSG